MKFYYVDSCIYLNLWKKEVDGYGNKLWEFAKNFFEKIESENLTIYYSGYLLKELMFVFDENKFIDKLELFNFSPNFRRANLTKEGYEIAKRIKRENREISFYDIIHMLLAKQTNSILITRDNILIKLAKKYQTNSILITRDNILIKLAKKYQIIVKKPEEIL